MLSPVDLAKKRRECRERVRSHRLKKKKSLSVPNTSTGSADEGKVYKTLQALRNSVSRVKQVLPNSPRKRRAVISKLAKSVNGISSNSPNPHRNGISNSESQVLSVFKLFSPLLNFTTSTRRKDYVSVRPEGKKMKLQKRHIMWSLKEVYQLFLKEHPEIKIPLSKFCSLRPVNVMLSSAMPRDAGLDQ